MDKDINNEEIKYFDSVAEEMSISDKLLDTYLNCDNPDPYTANRLPRLKRKILETLGEVKGKKVLVYGCGNDAAALWFSREGAQVDAIDISPKSVENQKKISNYLKIPVKAIVGDAHITGLPNNEYDIVYGNAILHHLDIELAAKEVSRILKSNGVGVFRDVLQGNVFLRAFRYLTPFWRTPDEHPLTKRDIEQSFKEFNSVSIEHYFLSALPIHFLSKFINNVIFRKIKFNLRISFPRCVYSFLDNYIDRSIFFVFPFMKYQSWICLITLKKNNLS